MDLDEDKLKDKELTMEKEDLNKDKKEKITTKKHIHARDFEDLKRFGKKHYRKGSKNHDYDVDEDLSDEDIIDSSHGKDEEHEHDTEQYIDEDHSKFQKNKHHIHKELERTRKHSGKHIINYRDHDDETDDDEERHSRKEESAEPEDFDG